jgi:DnaJ-class molecular chaperone
MAIPAPLTKGVRCPDCKGTGADLAKTTARDRLDPHALGYIRCWTCNGNGLDPSAYFNWSEGQTEVSQWQSKH